MSAWRPIGATLALLMALILHAVLITNAEHFLPNPAATGLEYAVSNVEYVTTIDVEDIPEEEPEERFVEVNQEALDNPPDETINVAAASTQAAQEEAAETLSEDRSPELESEFEVGPALTDRFARNPEPPTPPTAPQQDRQPQPENRFVANPPPAPPQSPDFLQRDTPPEEISEDGTRSILQEPGQGEEEVRLIGINDVIPLNLVPSEEAGTGEDPQRRQQIQEPIPPAQANPGPRPRPRLDGGSISQLVQRSIGGVERVGPVSWDARMTPFAEYLQQMSEPIKVRWVSLAINLMDIIAKETGTRVIIAFTLLPDGSVSDIRISESNAVSQTSALICQDAILAVSPFREWSPEMREALGDSTELSFGFWY